MRSILAFAMLLSLCVPTLVTAQSFDVHASGGPTLVDRGYSVAGGVGWSPLSHLQISVNAERTHLQMRVESTPQSSSVFRGGTVTVGSVEAQLSLLARTRFTPYVLAGFAAGRSRPNVNERFPQEVTNDVRAVFAGGGVLMPLRPNVALYADVRWMVGDEDNELLVVAPLRAGVSWRF